MITILTALRGNPALTARLLKAIGSSGPIIATVNNPLDKQAVSAAGGTPIDAAAYTGNSEVSRVNYVADLYATMMLQVATERVVLWDDDVLPPSKGLRILVSDLQKRPDAAGIVSVYPFNVPEDMGQAVLFWKPHKLLAASMKSIPNSGLHKVWGGGTGFSIWRTELLRQTLPWSTKIVRGSVPGWDFDLASKLEAMGRETFVDAGLRCRHDHLPS